MLDKFWPEEFWPDPADDFVQEANLMVSYEETTLIPS